MRGRLAATAALAVALGLPAGALARPPLDHDRALRNAEGAARKLARQDRRITEWEITRGFRFTSTKWVFAWWAQLGDGRICTAQLVTRYRNSKQNKVIAYFRQEECE
jgi:hypothetical protein